MKKEYLRKVRSKKIRLKENHLLSSTTLDLSYSEAMQLINTEFSANNYRQGQFFLEQLADQIKDIPEPTLYLMNVHLDNMDIDAADLQLNWLLERFPRDVNVLRHCARCHHMANRIDDAITLVKRSLKLQPANTHCLEYLGLLYLSSGNRERAGRAFDRALSLDSSHYGSILAKARIEKSSVSPEFLASLLTLLEDKKTKAYNLALLHYSLAWIYEHQDIDRHFQHLYEANEIISFSRPYDVKKEQNWVSDTLERYNRDSVDLLRTRSQETESPIFISALARSGTTLLEQMLSAHSQLEGIGESAAFRHAMKSVKQSGHPSPGWGSSSELNLTGEQLAQIADKFRNNYFVRFSRGKRIVDKSIGNTALLGMILIVFPRARVINLRRHPLDIIYSCYKQHFASGNNYSLKLEHLAENYKIHQQLTQHWQSLFPDKILSVRYEDLVSEPEPVLRRILEFCSLPWEPECLKYNDRVGVIKTASDQQVRSPLYSSSVNQWKKVEKYLQPAIQVLGDLVEY